MIYLSLFFLFANILLYSVFRKPKQPNMKEQFDFLLVLGCPCNPDGTLSSLQAKRVQAAMYYYTHGYSTTIVISGGSVHNEFNEASVMADALRNICPNATIHLETQARNTYQNLKHVKVLIQGNHILVISGSSHLRRSYFMVKKFYQDACMGCGEEHDPWYLYLWEYTRMWNALYWEVRLFLRK